MWWFQEYKKSWLLLVASVSLFIIISLTTQKQTFVYQHFTALLDKETWFTQVNQSQSKAGSSHLEERQSNFRKDYGIIKNHIPPENDLVDKYIIYRCTHLCGGLADRQKGIITSYVLSQMLRRKFGLIMKKGCDFSKYVIPNQVDWVVNESKLKGRSTGSKINIDESKLGIQMRDNDLELMFNKDVTYYQGNMDFVPFLMNKSTFSSLSWAKKRSHHAVYRIAFAQLFKFAPNTQHRYEEFQAKTRSGLLLCAHLRMGRTKTLLSDADLTSKRPDPSTLIRFLKRKVTNSSKLFIATDSDEVREQFKSSFPDQFIEIEGRIVHIDRSRSGYDCSAMEKVILDQFILSTCDILVMSTSGFSRIAAILRGTEDNLYLARSKNITKSRILNPT